MNVAEQATTYTIWRRAQILVNTDPQRRCYNGCHYSSEWRWTFWEELNLNTSADTVEDKLKFWRELNDYAVSARGQGARAEFKAVPTGEAP
jgi:hypothetical protein